MMRLITTIRTHQTKALTYARDAMFMPEVARWVYRVCAHRPQLFKRLRVVQSDPAQ